jgi:hypothetical protein
MRLLLNKIAPYIFAFTFSFSAFGTEEGGGKEPCSCDCPTCKHECDCQCENCECCTDTCADGSCDGTDTCTHEACTHNK